MGYGQLLHPHGAGEGGGDVVEDHEEAVAFFLQDLSLVGGEEREEQLPLLVDDVQEMQDAERLDLAGKPGEIREHDGAAAPEAFPDAAIHAGDIRPRAAAFVDEGPKLHGGGRALFAVGHADSVTESTRPRSF